LAAQIAVDLARLGKMVLTVPTEEPEQRVWERFYPMMEGWPGGDVTQAMVCLRVEEQPPSIDQLPSYVSRQILSPGGRHHCDVKLVILDSVQGHGLVSSATRAYDRVLETTRLLSSAGITTLLVNHLTKRGELAGPRTLEHGVDGVMLLRKTPSCQLMFVIKNRYGPASLRDPAALLLDSVTLRLVPTPLATAVHATAVTFLGGGMGPVDVQASVALAGYGTRGRVTAPGLSKGEIQQLISSLAELPGVEIDDMDFCDLLPGARSATLQRRCWSGAGDVAAGVVSPPIHSTASFVPGRGRLGPASPSIGRTPDKPTRRRSAQRPGHAGAVANLLPPANRRRLGRRWRSIHHRQPDWRHARLQLPAA
jgi:predicted ATP-dependent serine protease